MATRGSAVEVSVCHLADSLASRYRRNVERHFLFFRPYSSVRRQDWLSSLFRVQEPCPFGFADSGIGPGYMRQGKAIDEAEEGGRGGAGTLYLGSKYASNWAAIAAMAPAAFRMAPNASAILQPLKDHSVAVMIAQGDADELVPVAGTRQWVETMKEMKMVYNYKEVPGATHGSVIEASIPDIFTFFKAYTK